MRPQGFQDLHRSTIETLETFSLTSETASPWTVASWRLQPAGTQELTCLTWLTHDHGGGGEGGWNAGIHVYYMYIYMYVYVYVNVYVYVYVYVYIYI